MSLSNDVTITLGDAEYALKSSLKAATAVSNRFGGFQGAFIAVSNADLGAFQYVVRQGVPLRDISTKDLEEAVYEMGTRKLMPTVVQYVARLANGGRDPEEEDADEDGEEGEAGNGEV